MIGFQLDWQERLDSDELADIAAEVEEFRAGEIDEEELLDYLLSTEMTPDEAQTYVETLVEEQEDDA